MDTTSPRRALGRGARVALLTAVIAVTSVVLCLTVVDSLSGVAGGPPQLSWLVLVGMVILSEVLVVHLEARGEAHSITFSEVPLVVGLLLASPLHLVLARCTDEEIRKIGYENALRWLRFDPFKHVPREQATVGALRARAADVDLRMRSKAEYRREYEAVHGSMS